MTRSEQMLALLKTYGPVRRVDLVDRAQAEFGISPDMVGYLLVRLRKEGKAVSKRTGEGNLMEYAIADPSAQPKERGIRKCWPLADVVLHARSEPRNGGGPLFSDCADPATEAVIASLFEDDPDGQDIAQQVMTRIEGADQLLTASQIRPREVEAITFNTVLAKLVKAGCLARGWMGDATVGSYRYGRPGHPDLTGLQTERPKMAAPPVDQAHTVETASWQGTAIRMPDGIETPPDQPLPPIEPVLDRIASKQAPAPTQPQPADPATEPVTPREVDSPAEGVVPGPGPATKGPSPKPAPARCGWFGIAEMDTDERLSAIAAFPDAHESDGYVYFLNRGRCYTRCDPGIGQPDLGTPPPIIARTAKDWRQHELLQTSLTTRARLTDLDDLMGDLCDAYAPHSAIRAVHTASASLRRALDLLTGYAQPATAHSGASS